MSSPAVAPSAAPLYLKKGKERRLRFGHPWIYSNEVDVARSPLRGLAPGEPVELRSHAGAALASAYVNPASLICARIVSRDPGVPLDADLLRRRLGTALAAREQRFPAPFYRLAFGEGDGLPGLVVDRYADVLVAQLTTAGMERARGEVVAALLGLLGPRAIVLKNDIPARAREGLETYVEVAHGRPPAAIVLEENGARFEVAPGQGQKTGWYFDHRRNRARLLAHVAGKRVLDLFSYTGAWAVAAAVAGAREVVAVDSSEAALAALARNAALNGVSGRVRAVRADVFAHLRGLRAEGARFDVVVLDPPALIPRRKDAARGLEAYRRLNGLAMQVLGDGGLLVSASCSYHLAREKLVEILARVAGGIGRRAAIFEEGHQDADHPIHPALPETSYLKAFFVQVNDD